MEFLIRGITKLVPKYYLPKAHGVACNLQGECERLEFNTEERREYLAKIIREKKEQFLVKYSPIRRACAYKKQKTLNSKKRRYHELIGQIVLMHAGIEQNLKATLICDWGASNKTKDKKPIELTYGRGLIELFKSQMKILDCPKQWQDEYTKFLEEFQKLSRRRNDLVKSLWGHNETTGDIIQLDQLAHNNMLKILEENGNDFDAFQKQYISPITEIDLTDLLTDLIKMTENLNKVRVSIMTEKVKLYWEIFIDRNLPMPADAYKNPYKYIHLLSPSDE